MARDYKLVAVGFRGHFLRGTPAQGGTDFFENENNIQQQILTPIKDTGATIHTFVATYHSPCNHIDQLLLKRLNTKDVLFLQKLTIRPVDMQIKLLQLIIAQQIDYSHVLLLRFDVKYKYAITDPRFGIKTDRINFAWKEAFHLWGKARATSDLFFLFPGRYSSDFVYALNSSGSFNSFRFCRKCMRSGHFVYRFLEQRINRTGVFNFCQESIGWSGQTWAGAQNKSMVLAINRAVSHNASSVCEGAGEKALGVVGAGAFLSHRVG